VLVIQQMHELEAAVGGAGTVLEAVDEREVDLAGAQERHADVGLRLDQRQLDVGVEGAKPGDRRRHERRERTPEGRETQMPGTEAADGVELSLCAGEVLHGTETLRLTAGGFAFVPRGTLHRFANVAVTPSRVLIGFTPGGFEQFFFEADLPVVDGELAPPVGPEEIERSRAAAARHGMDVQWPQIG
jgi:hypothetical protein